MGAWLTRGAAFEAREQAPKVSGWFLRQIQNLYRIESALRDQKAGPALRQAVRAHQSRPIVERIHRALVRFKTLGRFLPKSLLGEAIDYALGQWSTLQVYLGNGRVEIDNNLVENAIRPTALGKKNWLFVGEAGAGQRAITIAGRYRHAQPWTLRLLRTHSLPAPHCTTIRSRKSRRKPGAKPTANSSKQEHKRQSIML